MKQKSISKTCKFFKDCPLGWGCLMEISQYGSAVWSLELCYGLIELVEVGLVKMGDGTLLENKIQRGMIYTFAR